MKKKFWKQLIGITFVGVVFLTASAAFAAPSTAVATHIVVDDTATDSDQENYFTYHGGTDENGRNGWAADTKSGNFSSTEAATQHWVWNNDTDVAARFTFSFTFTGTGVELIGIKYDDYMNFQLDSGAVEELAISGNVGTETVLYSRQELDDKQHTVHVTMPAARGGKGLQVSCAKVYGTVTDFIPNPASYTLPKGGQRQITYDVTPGHAVVHDMKFLSSNPDIASVDTSTGLVTANNVGETVITLSSAAYPAIVNKTVSVKVEDAIPVMEGSIVDIDTQYAQRRYEEICKMEKVTTQSLTAWKNDKAISSLVLISKDLSLKNVTVTASDLASQTGGNGISSKNVTATFIKSTKAYVGNFLGYGSDRPNAPIPAETAANRQESADILYQTSPIDIGQNEVQAVWLEFYIPVDAAAGTYTTTVSVAAEGVDTPLTFDYTVHVQDATLPDAAAFKSRFSIEFWHHPYASAEYYDVTPFSQEHLKILESMQDIYKEIGGSTIYTSIIEEPWSGQTWSKYNTNDRPTYPSMIKWMRDDAGDFSFDYTQFDTWVKFNIDRGLGDKIVMFSIAPWHNSFKYYEKETGVLKTQTFASIGGVGSDEYNRIWTVFLTDLVGHLEENGWFDRAYIGIDERGFHAKAFDVVESVKNSKDQHLKIMGYMDNVANTELYDLALRCTDYSIGDNAAQTTYPAQYAKLLAERNQAGLKTTFYSCTEHRPGNFSLSEPVESYFSVINAGKGGATGFARWAYDAWVPDPLEDATHSSFEPGDCFVIYPDLKSNKSNAVAKYSVRLARMAEGVRDMNKILLMTEQYPQLQTKVNDMYAGIGTKAYKENSRYLSESEINTLRTEMNTFKTGLAVLTEEYIRLGGKGDSKATGDFSERYDGNPAATKGSDLGAKGGTDG